MAAFANNNNRPSVTFDERPSIVSVGLDKSVTSLGSFDDDEEDQKQNRKASEWTFRPLKIKFKMKEFEKIYDRSVYRRQQLLLIYVCSLMVLIALLILLIFLGKEKVSSHLSFSLLFDFPFQFRGLPLDENLLEECANFANLTFDYDV